MARPLFNRIVTAITNYDPFFHNNTDCTGRDGISPLIKCTSAIRQLTYSVNGNFLDEYMQISERSSCMAFDHFCEAVIEIYGPEFLRKPTKLLRRKFYGYDMLSLVLLDRTTTSTFYINPLYLTISKPAEHQRFLLWLTAYPSEYYLIDGIYPELAPLIKTIREPADDDHKRILYKQKQELARKDVERAFGVLKKKWAVLANPTRAKK
nr:hypothetical protein [Tanacetum cinerariifolium]